MKDIAKILLALKNGLIVQHSNYLLSQFAKARLGVTLTKDHLGS